MGRLSVTPDRCSRPQTALAAKLSFIHPRWAREVLFWQFLYRLFAHRLAGGRTPRDRVALEFAPGVSLRLTSSDAGHLAIRYCGFLEYSLSRRIGRLAAKGGTFVDVGANYGYFTCLWAAAGPTNRVVAFEPSPRAFVALNENVSSNQLSDRVTLCRSALSKEHSIARFVESPDGQSGLSHLLLDDDPVDTGITIDVTTLDEFVSKAAAEISIIDVLKVDAEGVDTWVLYGAENLLREQRIKHLFFEYDQTLSEPFGITPLEARRFLERWGYEVQRIGRFVWYARVMNRSAGSRSGSPQERACPQGPAT